MQTFTVGQMAEILAKAKPSLSAAYLARQVRGWAQADLFPDASVRGSGRTAAQIFERHHFVTAQIYGFLTTLGMTVDQLKTVHGCLQNGGNIKVIVKDYDSGERDWRLLLYLTEDGEVWGGKFTKDNLVKENRLISVKAPNVLVITQRSIFRALELIEE